MLFYNKNTRQYHKINLFALNINNNGIKKEKKKIHRKRKKKRKNVYRKELFYSLFYSMIYFGNCLAYIKKRIVSSQLSRSTRRYGLLCVGNSSSWKNNLDFIHGFVCANPQAYIAKTSMKMIITFLFFIFISF